jgi:hypothetical protein
LEDNKIEPKKRKSKWVLTLIFLLIILTLWIIRPPSSYDKSKIDDRLTLLEEPFKEVRTSYFQDGGSISITIIDKNDTPLIIALPVRDFGDTSYDQIYFGVKHYSELKDGEVEVENPNETKLMLLDILDRYSDSDPYIDFVLCLLRGRAKDYINTVHHKMVGDYDIRRRRSK